MVKQIQHALQRLRINSGEMHSDLDQAQRDEMMYQFKSGQIDVLVATDIVARGIDIDDIAMVINFDVPRDAEDYVHRIGRTARADRDGRAITLVNPDDIRYFKDIERFLDKTIDKVAVPEELGETPEYKTANRSAKKTRRDNRNKNAHRRKPNKNKEPNNSHKGEPREAKNNNNRNGNPNKSRNNRRRPSRNDKPQATQESLRAKRHNNPKQTQPMKENKVENKKGIKNLLQKPLKWLRSKF